jgi:methyl-accepting chemotaxis protein
MARHWTFGRKVGVAFAVMVTLVIAISGVGVYALRTVVEAKDAAIANEAQDLVDAEELATTAERLVSAVRGFLLNKDETHLAHLRERDAALVAIMGRVRDRMDTERGARLLADIERRAAEWSKAADHLVALRKSDVAVDVLTDAFKDELQPRRDAWLEAIDAFTAFSKSALEVRKHAATRTASSATTLVMIIAGLAALFAAGVAIFLTRTLTVQVGTAVGQVQSSSTELQAAASQQASGAKEQATAMNEITTTINELLATSRQIASSAQRVAQIAEQTSSAARAGQGTVEGAHESIAGIRRQVDLIVHHMLELGRKSQQIGGVLEIVSELAEQTNILAINATIEAVGAGESGKRFSIVADEIRKLADRVGGSAKEIRALIDEVQSAVNTTVMTTETGSKAVDSGSKQFGDVASAFKDIVTLVTTTTEAAKEIELSTKQQATAVEQINVAVAGAAQATKETESSSSQTAQTARQLASLSKDLLRLVQPQASVSHGA